MAPPVLSRPVRPAQFAMAEQAVKAAGAGTGPAPPGTRAVSLAAALIKTSRPRQWPKNLLVFAAPAGRRVARPGRRLRLRARRVRGLRRVLERGVLRERCG